MTTISLNEDELRKGVVASPFSIFGNEVPVPIPFPDGHTYAVSTATPEEIAQRSADGGDGAVDLAGYYRVPSMWREISPGRERRSSSLTPASNLGKAAIIAVLGAAVPVLVRWALATFFGVEAG